MPNGKPLSSASGTAESASSAIAFRRTDYWLSVEQIVTAADGQTLTLKYKDGEKKIFVPANTPIVVYVPGDKSDLKPGAKVFIAAIKQPDGTLQGRAWRVGRDGVTPPM